MELSTAAAARGAPGIIHGGPQQTQQSRKESVQQKESSEDSQQQSESEESAPQEQQEQQTGAPAPRKKPRKRKSPSWKLRSLTFEDLQKHFDKPLHVAAQLLEVSDNGLKRLCRQRHIERWPYREIQGLRNTISHLKSVMDKSASPQERRKVNELLVTLQSQEQHLFDTGKCRDHAAALAEISPINSIGGRTLRMGNPPAPPASSQPVPGKTPQDHTSTPSNAQLAAAGGFAPRPSLRTALEVDETNKQALPSVGVASYFPGVQPRPSVGIGVSPPPIRPTAAEATGGSDEPQYQRLVWTVMEQLTLIADGQRSLAARIARMESIVDSHFQHRDSPQVAHFMQPPPMHLHRVASVPIDFGSQAAAGAAALGGSAGQLGTFYPFTPRPDLVAQAPASHPTPSPSTMHGFNPATHPLPRSPFL